MDLLERIRQERKFSHEVNGIEFQLEIPQINYILSNLETDLNKIDFLRQQVIGWTNANESHFVKDGDSNIQVSFNKEIFNEYIADRPSVVNVLFNEIIAKATERATRLNDLGKS